MLERFPPFDREGPRYASLRGRVGQTNWPAGRNGRPRGFSTWRHKIRHVPSAPSTTSQQLKRPGNPGLSKVRVGLSRVAAPRPTVTQIPRCPVVLRLLVSCEVQSSDSTGRAVALLGPDGVVDGRTISPTHHKRAVASARLTQPYRRKPTDSTELPNVTKADVWRTAKHSGEKLG